MLDCQISHVLGALDIGPNGFARILFHEGNMLVCRCVHDDVRLVFRKELVHPVVVTHIGNDRCERLFREFVPQFQVNLVGRGFSHVHQDEVPRLEVADLAAKLAADAPGCACHHDGAVGYLIPYFI